MLRGVGFLMMMRGTTCSLGSGTYPHADAVLPPGDPALANARPRVTQKRRPQGTRQGFTYAWQPQARSLIAIQAKRASPSYRCASKAGSLSRCACPASPKRLTCSPADPGPHTPRNCHSCSLRGRQEVAAQKAQTAAKATGTGPCTQARTQLTANVSQMRTCGGLPTQQRK